MNKEIRESVSALVDEELTTQERGEVIQGLLDSPGLQAEWARHHLIGEAMRGALPASAGPSMLAGIHQELAAEPLLPDHNVMSLEHERTRRGGFAKPLIGFALAASVAVVAVISVRHVSDPAAPGLAPVAEIQQPTNKLPSAVLASGNRWDVNRRSVEERLNSYLVDHSEYVGYGVQGMLPYARIVGYDTDGQELE